MDVTSQEYMVALAETKSITKAAKRLNISQPALSNWLNTIESQLNTRLVIRSKKQLTLTPAGQIYLDGCYKMIQIKQRTYGEILNLAGCSQAPVVISGTPNSGAELFAQIFSAFHQKFPAVPLRFLEGYNQQTLNYIIQGKADCGICSTLELESRDLKFMMYQEKELVLYLPASHRLAYDASGLKWNASLPVVDFSQLRDTAFVMPSAEMSYYNGLLQLFDSVNFHPKILFQSANVKVLYQMVRNGNGAAVLPRHLFSPLDPVAPFSLNPRFTVFSGIACLAKKQLTEPESYVIELLSQLMSHDEG